MAELDLDAMARAWRGRAAQRRAESDLLRKDALEKARLAAEFIKSHYGATRVYLYGSLAWSQAFGPGSDVDLLVEGFARPDAYWRMLTELWEISSPFPPSVVLAEDACTSLLARVREKGVELA